MIRLTKILVAVGLAFMAMVLTACPYIDHGTSKAAELSSLDEIRGCFYGTKYVTWDEIQVVYCTKFCVDSMAYVQYKYVYANMNPDSSFSIEKTYDETEYTSKVYADVVEDDGSVLYSFYIDRLGSFKKIQEGVFEKDGVMFTTKENESCGF